MSSIGDRPAPTPTTRPTPVSAGPPRCERPHLTCDQQRRVEVLSRLMAVSAEQVLDQALVRLHEREAERRVEVSVGTGDRHLILRGRRLGSTAIGGATWVVLRADGGGLVATDSSLMVAADTARGLKRLLDPLIGSSQASELLSAID